MNNETKIQVAEINSDDKRDVEDMKERGRLISESRSLEKEQPSEKQTSPKKDEEEEEGSTSPDPDMVLQKNTSALMRLNE
jgi:hypothetical protein